MSIGSARVQERPALLSAFSVWRAPRPEWPVAVVVGCVWIAYVCPSLADRSSMAHMAHAGALADVLLGLPAWALMTIAMMGPASLGTLRTIGAAEAPGRKQAMIAAFAVTYLLAWMLCGVVVLAMLAVWPEVMAPDVVAGSLVGVAVWHVSRPRTVIVRRWLEPPAPHRAVAPSRVCTQMRRGLAHGAACIASCGPLMVAVMVIPGPMMVWVVAGAVAVGAERLSPETPIVRWGVAAALAFIGLLVLSTV